MVLQTITGLFVLTMISGMPVSLAIGVTALGGVLVMQGIPLVVIPQKMFIGTDAFPLPPRKCSSAPMPFPSSPFPSSFWAVT